MKSKIALALFGLGASGTLKPSPRHDDRHRAGLASIASHSPQGGGSHHGGQGVIASDKSTEIAGTDATACTYADAKLDVIAGTTTVIVTDVS